MKLSLREFLRQHDVSIFFVLVFVCSWLHAIPGVAVFWGLLAQPPGLTIRLLLQVIAIVGGPAGAALLVLNTGSARKSPFGMVSCERGGTRVVRQ